MKKPIITLILLTVVTTSYAHESHTSRNRPVEYRTIPDKECIDYLNNIVLRQQQNVIMGESLVDEARRMGDYSKSAELAQKAKQYNKDLNGYVQNFIINCIKNEDPNSRLYR